MKILVVDDEEAVVEFLRSAAKACGITEVDTAASGEEALGQVIHSHYDAITVDIKLPGASGLEIVSILRNMCPHAVIAVISGHVPREINAGVLEAIDALICKPVRLNTVAALFAEAGTIAAARERLRAMSNYPLVKEEAQR
ncbi:MAG: response regulator [Candidatus Latescibacteria bacterium]|nr:response regulator [Candidatus Latescibacterota bacterium]